MMDLLDKTKINYQIVLTQMDRKESIEMNSITTLGYIKSMCNSNCSKTVLKVSAKKGEKDQGIWELRQHIFHYTTQNQ